VATLMLHVAMLGWWRRWLRGTVRLAIAVAGAGVLLTWPS